MRQRTERLLHGLWEFYLVDEKLGEDGAAGRVRQNGFTLAGLSPAGEANHVFTHMVWRMRGFYCRVSGGRAPEGHTFVDKAAVGTLAVPTALRLFADYLQRAEE